MLSSADILIRNTWGEIFFHSVDLTRIENHLLQCYSIATGIWSYMKNVPCYELQYRIFEVGVNTRLNTRPTIEALITKLTKNAAAKKIGGLIDNNPFDYKKNRLLLDRFVG